jgi:stage II sporulation protein D
MRTLFAWLSLLLACAATCGAQELRIGVLSRYHPMQLEVKTSETQALVIDVSRESFVLEPDSANATAEIRVIAGQLLVDLRDHRVVAKRLRVMGRTGAADFILAVPGKVGRRYFGTLDVVARHGELEAVVTMDLETAVASVVQAETEPQTPIEALKAQAIVTRSYFAAARERHQNFEFCDLAHCQVLRGRPGPESPAVRATAATRGLVLAYENKPFAAMFTRSCGGRTRTPAEDGLPFDGYPYFPVICEYCRKHPFRWTRTISTQDARLLAQGENGRLALCRRMGWNVVPSDDVIAREDAGGVVLKGKGQGHGIGLCQRGAEALAASGADFRAILADYFPNTSLKPVREPESGAPLVHSKLQRRLLGAIE